MKEVRAAAAGFSASRLERITEHLQRNYIDTGRIVGAQVAVARHGELAYWHNFGLRDRERALPIEDDTIFRIYSMTKPLTSIALMQLYERGLFQLNDPIHRVLPGWRDQKVYVSGEGDEMELKAADQPVTFRHVLSHTAGLSYGATRHPVDRLYRKQGVRRDEGETLETFTDKLAGLPLFYEPGSRWMYSYATDLCGRLVEVLSGQTLDQYFTDNLFEPLGMRDTAFHIESDKTNRFAANYQRRTDKSLELIDDPQQSSYGHPPSFLSGGGGLTSTTADYLRFCEMLRGQGTLNGQRIIGSRTLDLMTRNHLPGDGELSDLAIGAFSETAYEGVGFGLGFAMTLDAVAAGGVGEGEYYWGGAASTIFWVDPEEDLSAVFMTQLMPSATFNFRGQLKNIIYAAMED